MPQPNRHDLSDKHGYFKIWPTIPVWFEDWGCFVDAQLFNLPAVRWLEEIAKKQTPSQDELRIIGEALTINTDEPETRFEFDPNNISHAGVIAPLRKLGFISDKEISRIIEDATIDVSISTKAGSHKIIEFLDKQKSVNGVQKSPGLRVLEELLETNTLSDLQIERINQRKTEFVDSLATKLSATLNLS